jgi:hypothetical protein
LRLFDLSVIVIPSPPVVTVCPNSKSSEALLIAFAINSPLVATSASTSLAPFSYEPVLYCAYCTVAVIFWNKSWN